MARTPVCAKLALTANQWNAVYTVSAAPVLNCNVNFNVVNDGTSTVSVRVAIGANPPGANDPFESSKALILAPGGRLERSAIVALAGEIFTFYPDATGIVVRVYGYEES